MKKNQVTQFYPWSAEYVVAHALWQKSRGRGPSVAYRGEKNPRKALALAKGMAVDTQFRDVVVRSVNEDSFTGEDGWTFDTRKEWGVAIRPGDIARFYGRGVGSTVRGLDINGVECYYRTQEQQAEKDANELRESEAEDVVKFEKNKAKLDAAYANLPEVFQRRIDKFRANNPDFRVKYESYEMFCCEQAVAIATGVGKQLVDEAIAEGLSLDAAKAAVVERAPDALQNFYDMSWKKQVKIVPELSDGHSGNTFGCAVTLAGLYMNQRLEDIVRMHGALAPLVGSKEYGCVPRA